MAVELLGASLAALRRSRSGGQLAPPAAALLTLRALRALQALHARGVLHRDVKPSNMVQRAARPGQIALLDFGLARFYLHRAPRRGVGFRGTPRYASLAAHAGRDLAPVDDLWSLWYSAIELLAGGLPWKALTDRAAIAQVRPTRQDSTTGRAHCAMAGGPRDMRTGQAKRETQGRDRRGGGVARA